MNAVLIDNRATGAGRWLLLRRCAVAVAILACWAPPDATAQVFDATAAEETADAEEAYRLGMIAQREQRYADAINHFERAVLINPNHAGAWLDLAIAYFSAGDFATAANLLDHVEGQFAPGPKTAESIASVRASIAQARLGGGVAAARTWRGEVSAGLGYGRNINSAPNLNSVFLTLSNQRLELLLSENQRPVHAPFGRADLLLTWAPQGDWRQWEGVFNIDGRVHPGNSSWNLVTALAGVSRSWTHATLPDRSWQAALYVQHVQLGTDSLQTAMLGNARYRWKAGSCAPSVGFDVEKKIYPAEPTLDSSAFSVKAGIECQTAGLVPRRPSWMPDDIRTEIRAGRDFPDADRPGGRQDRWEWTIQGAHRFERTRLDYNFQIGRYADTSGYSPLLEDNAVRHNLRRQLVVGLSRAMSPGVESYVQAHALRQNSNISLFKVTMTSVQAGVRWRF